MLPETHRDLTLPPLYPDLEKYHELLEGSVRPAWLLRCQKVEAISRFQTHIGGSTPFAPIQEGWPLCDSCGKPLEFVWQIDFADFKGVGVYAERGLFQFFYCWECFPLPPEDDSGYACRWYPDFDALLVEDIPQLDTPLQVIESDYSRSVGPFEVQAVPFLSVPNDMSQELPIPTEALEEIVEDGDTLRQVYGDFVADYIVDKVSQVGGYPDWIQYDDTPSCPVCERRAEFVAAIGSDDTDLLWGDAGYWYFFACRATEDCPGLDKPLMRSQSY
jgi:uncharacterized protein YwqG